MANKSKKRKENVDGNYYVDSTCIDCGTCYWVCPTSFKRVDGLAAVYHQPINSKNEDDSAYRAMLSCPVNAIGVNQKNENQSAADFFPHSISENIFHLGFHAENSFGAASYFIQDKFSNIMIDSPRYVKVLANQIQSLGGVHLQLLSHKDDIADTDKYWELFQGKRYIHEYDSVKRTSHYEEFFKGEDEIKLTKDLLVIPVPGHTKGSVCYLYKEKYLFTGDHLAYSENLGHLYAFRSACWYDFDRQIESMKKLLDYRFEYILPGHGRPFQGPPAVVKKSLEKCIKWMQD